MSKALALLALTLLSSIYAAEIPQPSWTNHNRIAGSQQMMTNFKPWAEAVESTLGNKRDKTDLAVYEIARTENTDWTWTSESAELAAVLNANGAKPVYASELSAWDCTVLLPDGWTAVGRDPSSPQSSTRVNLGFSNPGQGISSAVATATRPRYMDETLGPAKTNVQLAAVATGDAQTPANGDLVKYDAANDRFVKAVAGTDYLPLVEDSNGDKTAVTIGTRKSDGPVGRFSLANGSSVDAFNNYSHAEGEYTTASGEYSHAEGQASTASGPYSHAEGGSTKASGVFSHVEGHSTQASGSYSHAEGNETYASGDYSHAEGYQTSAGGTASHTEGYQTSALANYSHASGIMSETKSGHDYAFVWNGDQEINHQYVSNGPGTFNINPYGGLGGFFIGDRSLPDIFDGRYLRSESQGGPPGYVYVNTNVYFSTARTGNLFVDSFYDIRLYDEHGEPLEDWVKYIARTLINENDSDFSNAVLAVGLNIDTNSVAVLNEIANTFGGFPLGAGETATTVGGLLAALAAAIAWLKKNKVGSFASVGGASATVENGVAKLDNFFTESNSLLTGTIDAEVISKGTAPDAHLEVPTGTDDRLKLILADNSVAYDSAKALPYKLTSVIGDRVVATMTLTAASTDITLPAISSDDTTVKDFILDVTNAYAVEGVATDAGINIPRTDFKLVTRDGESLTAVTTVKAGKSAFICFTQKSPVVVDGTTYPCWCVIQLPFGDPS